MALTNIIASSICLLNTQNRSNVTLEPLHQLEHNWSHINAVDLGPRVIVVQGQVGRDRNADWRLVALDVQTRTQLLLPSFSRVMWEVAQVGSFLFVRSSFRPTEIWTSTTRCKSREPSCT